MNDLKTVSANGTAGFGDFDNSVHESLRGLRFGGAPGKFYCHRNVSFGEVALGEVDHFRGNPLALEVFDFLDRGVLGHGQNPAGRAKARLRIDHFTDHMDIRIIFESPILAGNSHVQSTHFDITGHLLWTRQTAANTVVVNRRKVTTARGGNFPSRFSEKLDGHFLKAALGNAEL